MNKEEKEEYSNLEYENIKMGEFLEKLGFTPEMITNLIIYNFDNQKKAIDLIKGVKKQ